MTDDEIEKLAFQDSVNRVKRRQARETRKRRSLELLSRAAAASFFLGLGMIVYLLWSTLP